MLCAPLIANQGPGPGGPPALTLTHCDGSLPLPYMRLFTVPKTLNPQSPPPLHHPLTPEGDQMQEILGGEKYIAVARNGKMKDG